MANKQKKSKQKTKTKQSKVLKKIKKQATKRTKWIEQILASPGKLWKFLKSVRNELKEVEWLSRKNTTKWTSAVISTAIALGAILVLLDYVFFELRSLLFDI